MSNFTRAALRSEIEQVRKEALPPIEWQEFKRISPGAEDIIQFGRGTREDFRDGVHFWLTVLVYRFHDSNFPDVETFLQTSWTMNIRFVRRFRARGSVRSCIGTIS